jgi:hypothetical protein
MSRRDVSTCAQAIVQKRPSSSSRDIASLSQRRIAAGERRRTAAVRIV